MKQGAPEPIAALNRVKIVESGEPLVDIRLRCPAARVRDGCCPFLRSTVADMLNAACGCLPSGYYFTVGTATRTLTMQRKHWDNYHKKVREEHPNWPLSALRRGTNRFFAPYDQPAPPGHCTGAAVDVGLYGPDDQPVDVSSPLEGWAAAYTWSERISDQARSNRMILVDAMLGAGFSNCREEFWHYSWGDSSWGVRVGLRSCPYGLVEPPVCVESSFEGGVAGEISAAGHNVWKCRPIIGSSPTSLLIGVFWAAGRAVTLQVEPTSRPDLYISADMKVWTPLSCDVVGNSVTATCVPDDDRMFVADVAPPPAVDAE